MWQLFIGPATPRPDFSIFPVRYIFTILHSPHFTLTYPTLLSLVFTTVHIHTAVLLVYSLPFAYRPFSFHIHQLCLSLLFFLVTTFHTHILFSSLCHIHHLSHSNFLLSFVFTACHIHMFFSPVAVFTTFHSHMPFSPFAEPFPGFIFCFSNFVFHCNSIFSLSTVTNFVVLSYFPFLLLSFHLVFSIRPFINKNIVKIIQA